MVIRVVLIRHGETLWNREHRLQGTSEVALSVLGRRQAVLLARNFREPVHRLYVSPQKRALSFAAPLAGRLELKMHVLPELKEMSFGSWEGRSYAGMTEDEKKDFLDWSTDPAAKSPPGGETLVALAERVEGALVKISGELQDGQTAVVVTHGGVIRAAVARLMRMPLSFASRVQVDPASITVFTFASGTWKLVSLNDTCYLRRASD